MTFIELAYAVCLAALSSFCVAAPDFDASHSLAGSISIDKVFISIKRFHDCAMAIPGKVRDFINEQRQPLPPVTDMDEPLELESLQMTRLVAFLETEIDFIVDDFQLVPENFKTLRAIEQLLDGKGIGAD